MNVRSDLKILCVLSIAVLAAAQTSPEVDINLGKVRGKTETVQRGDQTYTVDVYLGIPFAKPPVGNLRFRKPEEPDSLGSNPHNASYYRPYCPHMMGNGLFWAQGGTEDEDCLYLNVFAPRSSADQPSGHAVMVWIYGGGFISGAANDYHGSMLAATGNVIVVTFNYRIGVFGFFTTMDSVAPGNYGLFDQIMAFDWVNQNIAMFGGDQSRITIFGESAGSMSVSMQSLYEPNNAKFQRLIAQSGTANMPGSEYKYNYLPSTMFVAKQFGCPTDDSNSITECLRQIPWTDVKNKFVTLLNDPTRTIVLEYSPRLDGDFIKYDYENLSEVMEKDSSKAEFFRSLDVLVGFNAYEGGLYLQYAMGEQNVNDFQPKYEDMEDHLLDRIPSTYVIPNKLSPALKKAILHEYTNWTNPYHYESVRLQFTKIFGDAAFITPAVTTARHHADGNDFRSTYVYCFKPVMTFRMPFTPSWLPGADHAEELTAIFGIKYAMMQDWEKQLSTDMVSYWTNFAKTGNPSPAGSAVTWPKYDMTNQSYMELDKPTEGSPVKHFAFAKETHFWTEVVPTMLNTETGIDHCSASTRCTMNPMMSIMMASTIATAFYLL